MEEISFKENFWEVWTRKLVVYTNIWLQKRYEEAKKSIETRKEDFEQAKLILEESQVEEQVKEILTFPKITNSKQKTKEIREETARKELEEIF